MQFIIGGATEVLVSQGVINNFTHFSYTIPVILRTIDEDELLSKAKNLNT